MEFPNRRKLWQDFPVVASNPMESNQNIQIENILYFRYYPALDLFLLRLKNQTPIPYRSEDSFKFYAQLKAKGIQEA